MPFLLPFILQTNLNHTFRVNVSWFIKPPLQILIPERAYYYPALFEPIFRCTAQLGCCQCSKHHPSRRSWSACIATLTGGGTGSIHGASSAAGEADSDSVGGAEDSGKAYCMNSAGEAGGVGYAVGVHGPCSTNETDNMDDEDDVVDADDDADDADDAVDAVDADYADDAVRADITDEADDAGGAGDTDDTDDADVVDDVDDADDPGDPN